MARPTVMTEEVLQKLEGAASMDLTIRQSCFYADICVATYYNYLDEHPEFIERLEGFRTNLNMKSRMNIATAVEEGSIHDSWKYLERRDQEYTEKTESQITVKDETTTDEYDENQTSNILELVQNGTATAT